MCCDRLNKETIPSRAYLGFKTEEQLALFSRCFDGHIFKDKAGVWHPRFVSLIMLTLHTGIETQAVVEFAPYQKVPFEKSKTDNRMATIEEGVLENIVLLHCPIYTNTTQTKITSRSSSRWKITPQSRLMMRHWNI